MSNLVCPVCGSSNIQTERRPDGFHHCMECRYSWAIGASQQKQTVFDKITESVETLAEKLVYEQVVINNIQINYSHSAHNEESCTKMWKSALLPLRFFDDKQKALEATIEELNKEAKDENNN